MLHLHKRWKRTASGASKECEIPDTEEILPRASGPLAGPLYQAEQGATFESRFAAATAIRLTVVTGKS
jgi:hypothetical protein